MLAVNGAGEVYSNVDCITRLARFGQYRLLSRSVICFMFFFTFAYVMASSQANGQRSADLILLRIIVNGREHSSSAVTRVSIV